MRSTKIASHRGIHADIETQENTLAAIERAVKLKVDYVEFDTLLTKDQVWVLNHDLEIEEGKPISEMTYEELTAYSDQHGRNIDTLSRVLSNVKNFRLNIECKEDGYDQGQKLAHFLQDYNVEYYNVSSFFGDTLLGYGEADKETDLSYLGYLIPYPKWWWLQRRVKLFSVNPYFSFATKSKIKFTQNRGLEIHTWTVNEESDIRRMIEYGADAIITDYPADAMVIREEYLREEF